MKLKWSPAAQRDLCETVEFIAQDNPRAADTIEDRLLNAANALVDHPENGRSGRRAGTREWMVPKTPYLLIYKQTKAEIEIVRVWHMNREPFD